MSTLSSRFYSTFPREFGLKRRIVHSEEDFWNSVNRHNGLMNCYTNLYDYAEHTEWGKPVFESCIWDRMIWDFDNEGDLANELTVQVSDYLKEKNILHTNVFSGRGYHIYSFCNPQLESPSFAVRNFQEEVCKDLGIPLHVKDGLDPTSIANGTKIIRIIGTMNIREEARRVCRGVSTRDIKLGHSHVRELCKTSTRKLWKRGSVDIDLSAYDKERVDFSTDYDIQLEADDITEIYVEELAPCIRALLENPDVNDLGRQVTASWLSFLARDGLEPGALTRDARRAATKVVCKAIADFGDNSNRKWSKYMPERRVANVIDNILNPYSCKRMEAQGMCTEPGCSMSDGGVI